MATEGNLQAPTRHPLDWQNPDFYNEEKCFDELERIFDICHGCRRCVSLCQSFNVCCDDQLASIGADAVLVQEVGIARMHQIVGCLLQQIERSDLVGSLATAP